MYRDPAYDESGPRLDTGAQYDRSDSQAVGYAGGDSYGSQYEDPYDSGIDPNQYAGDENFEDPYDDPVAPEGYSETPIAPRASSWGDPEYYVSLEPCCRGSMCEPVDPKCMIRLVGNGYRKDIELLLDSKMDTLIHSILRCLDDEGVCLDGVRLQGLPKKNCLKNCLAAICAPFAAFCSGPITKPACCQTFPYSCCCPPITCQRRSSDVSPRRSTSPRYSVNSRRPSVCSNRSRRGRRHRRSYDRKPCRMVKVCQGPYGEDCVLIKISPSLPKMDGVKSRKRSTGVGTDELPELEILLQGGNKKRCAAKNKAKICSCPHCCSSGKLKIIKCRSRVPKRREHHDEMHQEYPAEEEWPQQHATQEEWHYTDDDQRMTFAQPPQRSSVNFVLVEGCSDPLQRSESVYSDSLLVLQKEGPNPSGHKGEICVPIKRAHSLKVYPMQTQNSDRLIPGPSGSFIENKKRDKQTALLMREVLHLANEIVKNHIRFSSEHLRSGKYGENPPPARSKLSPIFRRSYLWLSDSDVDVGPIVKQPPNINPPRRFSTKSVNFVARLKKSTRRKKSPKTPSKDPKSTRLRSEPKSRRRNDEACGKFEKLQIYTETDKTDEPAKYVPIELTKKEASVNLNTLIQ